MSQYLNATQPFTSHGPQNNLVAIVSIATKYGILENILCIALGGKSSSGLNRPYEKFLQRPHIGSTDVGSEVPRISILLDRELLSVVPP
jgi:hypothetical protein